MGVPSSPGSGARAGAARRHSRSIRVSARQAGRDPSTTSASTASAPARPRDDRVEVDLDDRRVGDEQVARPPRRRPRPRRRRRRPSRARRAGAPPHAGPGAARRPPPRVDRREQHGDVVEHLGEDPADPTSTAGPNTASRRPPTISSTPAGAIGSTSRPRGIDAGPRRRRGQQRIHRRARSPPRRPAPSAHPAGVALVGELRGVELERDRAAAEVAPRRDGRRRPAAAGTRRHGRHGHPGVGEAARGSRARAARPGAPAPPPRGRAGRAPCRAPHGDAIRGQRRPLAGRRGPDAGRAVAPPLPGRQPGDRRERLDRPLEHRHPAVRRRGTP